VLVVGFDLDMTLADPRPGVIATFTALSAELGVTIDAQLAASRLGPPLEVEVAAWVPAEAIAPTIERYREIFATLGVEGTSAMPGAAAALEAVRANGGRTLLVTAKSAPLALATQQRLGLETDETLGQLWGPTKGEALAARRATIYVGDHTGDMLAAHTCGAVAVAVTTGPDDAAALEAAGAHIILGSLEEFPDWLASYLLDTRLLSLQDRLQELETVLVAFSGGADSAFLLAAAARALGPEQVVAATAVSPSLPARELDDARRFAESLGVRHLTPTTDELAREGYRANAGDRCFFCKAELLDVLAPLAAELGIAHVATGTNADDAAAGFRPGIRAAAERGALTPLLDAGLTKAQVRAASRQWSLPTWDKPAAACLSSRIPYGSSVTRERLAQIAGFEADLRALGFRQLRVRWHDTIARIEVEPAELPRFVAPELRDAVVAAGKKNGFLYVTIDLAGYRQGSHNEVLAGRSLRVV
jgi:pyridinium-3,5-biscarboxylic acid mononucleotide sulfurtransferase